MANITRVSPDEAYELMIKEEYIYLDVRSEPEYSAGHPAGAHNVPVLHAGPGGMSPNPEFMEVVSAVYGKGQKLIVGCRSGARSMRAAEMMISAGFAAVIEQRAGFEGPRDAFGRVTEPGWASVGLPVETSTPGGSYADLKKKLDR